MRVKSALDVTIVTTGTVASVKIRTAQLNRGTDLQVRSTPYIRG